MVPVSRQGTTKELGLEVPKTYAELLEMAPKLSAEGPNGPIYGVITRFDKYWDLPYLTFGTMLQSYGVEMIDADGKLQICSPESIAATTDFIERVRPSPSLDLSPGGLDDATAIAALWMRNRKVI